MLFAALAAFAQTVISGDLTGTVTDQQGAVITDAKVIVKSLSTGTTNNATTNKSGVYRFSLLKPGDYQLVVEQTGFKKLELTTAVAVGQTTKADLHLTLGKVGEVVEVTEQVSLLDSENANSTTTYTPEALSTIPSPGGDTTAFALTTPGITVSTGGGYGNFSANGLPGNANLFTTNGFDNNDPWNNLNNSGASNLALGANELQEMTVVINGYTGQYGRQAGAQVNSVTKSGTNAFHGNLLYWWNGRAMNGNDWISKSSGESRPFSNNNQYAASIGGPIVKDKLFFFANHEQMRVILPSSSGIVSLPTAQFANAVLATIPAAQLPFYNNIFNLYAGATGASNAVPVSTSGNGDGACGGIVTVNHIAFGPGALPCAGQYTIAIPAAQHEWLLMTRIDYNISDKDRFFGRFKDDQGVQATSTNAINQAFSANSNQPAYEGQLQETHIFNSKMVNQFITGASVYKAIFGPANLPGALAAFPTTMQFVGGDLSTLGANDNRIRGRNVTQYMIIDDLSRNQGSHNLKFGINFRGDKISDYYHLQNSTGTLNLAVADLAAGYFDPTTNQNSYFNQRFPSVRQVPVTSYSLGLYAQDEWKANSRTTVTLAARFDRNSNFNCLKNCFSRLNNDFSAINHDPTVPLSQVISTKQGAGFPGIEPIAFEPRLGLVYDLHHGTVVRGGVGIFSDLFPANLMQYMIQAPSTVTYTANGTNVVIGDANTAGNIFQNTQAQSTAFQSAFASGSTTSVQVPFYTFPKSVKNPKFLEWNAEVEQQIGAKGALTLNYAANHGYDMFIQNPFVNAYYTLGAMPGLNASAADSRFTQVVSYTNTGHSNYDGLTANFKWRFSGLFQGSFSYTWSHGLDDCSNECIFQYNYLTTTSITTQLAPGSLKLNYGPSDYDTRQAFNANYLFTTPRFDSRLMRNVGSNWSVAGTFYYHSGYPFSFINSGANGGIANISDISAPQLLADYTGSVRSCTNPNASCISTTDFQQNTDHTQANFGTLNRNSFRGPGYFDTDLQVMKSFPLTETIKLSLGANIFNLLNHPNFDLPVNDLAASSVGSIVSTVSAATSPYGSFVGAVASGRIIQLHAKVVF